MKLLLYCTKGDKNTCLEYADNPNKNEEGKWCITSGYPYANGKIVGECDFEVSEIESHQAYYSYYGPAYFTKRKEPFKYFSYLDLLEASCLRDDEIFKYLGNNGGYAIHIKNLHIFDEPRELSDYYIKQCQFGKCSTCEYGKNNIFCSTIDTPVEKAPQNMCYVFDGEEKKVLISIRPEWMCKILNGEKTIEVRKKVLKEML